MSESDPANPTVISIGKEPVGSLKPPYLGTGWVQSRASRTRKPWSKHNSHVGVWRIQELDNVWTLSRQLRDFIRCGHTTDKQTRRLVYTVIFEPGTGLFWRGAFGADA